MTLQDSTGYGDSCHGGFETTTATETDIPARAGRDRTDGGRSKRMKTRAESDAKNGERGGTLSVFMFSTVMMIIVSSRVSKGNRCKLACRCKKKR